MSAYDAGYATGQIIGYLLVAGLLIWFLYYRKKKQKKDNDNTLDQI